MAKLHFGIRDLFRAVRLGWSGKKIWIGLIGLLVAWIEYTVLVYVGYAVSGTSANEIWHAHGLFPGAAPDAVSLPGALIHVLAMVLSAVVLFCSTCMMCKVTYQHLRGDDFYSSGDAWKFLKEHWGGAVFGPVAVLALLAMFLVSGVVIGWLAGVIPYLGEWAFALGFIPIFFASLVAVFIVVALAAAVLMSPAIVGTVGEDALEVVIQSFSLSWSQPWRLGLYLIWLSVSVYIGVTLLSGFMTLAFGLISYACGMFMGSDFAALVQTGRLYLPPCDFTMPFAEAFEDVSSVWPASMGSTPSGSVVWAGRVMGLNLIVLTGILLAYAQSAYASGATMIYVILRRMKDDENMLEWEDPSLDEPLDYSSEDEAGARAAGSADADEVSSAGEGDTAVGSDAAETPPPPQ